ncbi:hypothetical protein [Myxococcus sp. RHSTA-1-4]|uniref:hypothetical protein n=1 Tax=Myxococcus sp. RHSTA-1-4 TaxID=2874601 RepID=UPI001CBBC372|nr:hypothetical protein [Myxococcus sp. RHSTA-1-4]MBZ4415079.1 hypothetical protein [Myxococcus sp. RHSTA-1-4]
MRCWMPLLLVVTSACGALPEPLSRALCSASFTAEPVARAQRTVHVYVPPDVEDVGARAPLLYLGDGEARFFPGGAGEASHSVEPGPSELVTLLRRPDIVIIAVDREPGSIAHAPGEQTHYVTHGIPRPPT